MSKSSFVIALPPSNRAERRYVCEYVFTERLGVACSFVDGDQGWTVVSHLGRTLLVADVLLAGDDSSYFEPSRQPLLQARAMNLDSLRRENGPGDIVAPYLRPGEQRVAKLGEIEIVLNVDLLGTVFFMLTRLEEVISAERDEHGRFPARASWAVKNDVERRPIVDECIDVLRSCLERLWPGATCPLNSYEVRPSHDIDHPFLYHGLPMGGRVVRLARKLCGDVMIRRSLPEAGRSVAGFIECSLKGALHDPYCSIRALMDESERLGLKSTFFLIVMPSLAIDGRPYMAYPEIGAAVGEILRRGHAIGLHASYQTLRAASRAAEEMAELQRFLGRLGVVPGEMNVRHHYLRWSGLEHWAMWEAAGANIDSTLGFSDRLGFRCGTSYEFPAFDLQTRRQLSLRERPLILMDGTIFPEAGLRGSHLQRVLDELRTVAGRCRYHGGRFELLWHNTFLVTRAQRMMYREVLDACTGVASVA